MPRTRSLQPRRFAALFTCLAVTATAPLTATEPFPGLVEAGFIYDEASFPECHASTIAEAQGGLVAAWFGGTREGKDDVGVWVARKPKASDSWTSPVEVANGVQTDGSRHPCWNPVLFQPHDGPLLLFYKVGPSPRDWWGMRTTSKDGGKTWTKPTRLPDEIAGPIKNRPVLLANGRLLCGSSTEDQGWRVHMEWTDDLGLTWERTAALNDGKTLHAIQPTILNHGDGRLQILCRGRGTGAVVEGWSEDNGETWSELKAGTLPNPNSGIHAVTLKDGRHLLIYNHTRRGRSPLNVAVSSDGRQWFAAGVLESEPGEYSYPTVMQTADGLVHVTYTWKRDRVKHVVLQPDKLKLKEIRDGRWPE